MNITSKLKENQNNAKEKVKDLLLSDNVSDDKLLKATKEAELSTSEVEKLEAEANEIKEVYKNIVNFPLQRTEQVQGLLEDLQTAKVLFAEALNKYDEAAKLAENVRKHLQDYHASRSHFGGPGIALAEHKLKHGLFQGNKKLEQLIAQGKKAKDDQDARVEPLSKAHAELLDYQAKRIRNSQINNETW